MLVYQCDNVHEEEMCIYNRFHMLLVCPHCHKFKASIQSMWDINDKKPIKRLNGMTAYLHTYGQCSVCNQLLRSGRKQRGHIHRACKSLDREKKPKLRL